MITVTTLENGSVQVHDSEDPATPIRTFTTRGGRSVWEIMPDGSIQQTYTRLGSCGMSLTILEGTLEQIIRNAVEGKEDTLEEMRRKWCSNSGWPER